MKVKKRILSCLTAAALVLTMLPATALAAGTTYQDGTYQGTGTGYGGTMTLSVTIADDKITAIENVSNSETASVWTSERQTTLFNSIIAAQSTEVDTISGATYSCNGVKTAVNNALSQAVIGFAGGTGTEADPYLVSNEAGLRYLQTQVAAGTSYAGQYIQLTADVALTKDWTPIGDATNKFAGTFDGGNHTISGMTIKDATLARVGLFGTVDKGGSVKNVALTGVVINIENAAANVYVGALVGFMQVDSSGDTVSVIDNCFASGTISVSTANKMAFVGGLIGFSNQQAAVTNCGTNVNITVDSGTGNATVGGLEAWSSAKTLHMNDYALGNVTVTSNSTGNINVGGLIGQASGIYYNCYNAGSVTLTTTNTSPKQGTIVGNVPAATYVDSCYYTGSTEGNLLGTVSGSYNQDTVLSKASVSADELATLLHNNLASDALTAVSEKVTAANITDCTDFSALTGRVDDKFYDWEVSDGAVVLSDSLWTTGEIDASIFDSGSGTEADPYIIKTAEQLRAFAGSLNSKIDYTNKYVALGADIDLSGTAWTSIGGSDYLFNGTLNGGGIRSLTCPRVRRKTRRR